MSEMSETNHSKQMARDFLLGILSHVTIPDNKRLEDLFVEMHEKFISGCDIEDIRLAMEDIYVKTIRIVIEQLEKYETQMVNRQKAIKSGELQKQKKVIAEHIRTILSESNHSCSSLRSKPLIV